MEKEEAYNKASASLATDTKPNEATKLVLRDIMGKARNNSLHKFLGPKSVYLVHMSKSRIRTESGILERLW